MRSIIASIFRIFFRLKLFRHTYFGFYQRIFKPFNLFKGVRKRIVYRNRIILVLDIEDWIQQNLYLLNEYEESEIKFVERSLKKGDVFIDVGAHIGLFSLVASTQTGEDGRVYAFEPIQKNYDSLTRHIHLNKMENVVPEKLAVTNNREKIKLYLNEQDSNRGMASAYADTFTMAESVPSTSLDIYFANKDVGSVRLIKIDIEGGEYLALIGMLDLLKRHKPMLLMEINPDTPYGIEKIEKTLFDLDYKKYFLNADGQLISKKLREDKSNNYVFSCQD